MSLTRRKYDAEFKKNAVKLSYASPKTIKEVAEDLGITESMLYCWRQRYTTQGDKTQTATLEEENKALRLENAELKMERDMLPLRDNSKTTRIKRSPIVAKKAAAYFAKFQK